MGKCEQMVLVFDLDDTLYDEITYVESGFRAVANFLEIQFGISRKTSFGQMVSMMNRMGRGKVFDEVLSQYGLLSKRNISACLSVYRAHEPKIKLSKTAKSCLIRFGNTAKYLVTDGNKLVQQKKIRALKIEQYFEGIYITHRYGVARAKPAPYCFLQISKKEKTSPSKIVYVGDNPKKDFVGLKPLGFKTIRILKGAYKDLELSKQHEADIQIRSLRELNSALLDKLVSG